MAYINRDGTVSSTRPSLFKYYAELGPITGPKTLIRDLFWGIIDFFALFFGSLLNPSKPIPKRQRPYVPPSRDGGGDGGDARRRPGANIRSIPKASTNCSTGG